MRPPKLRRRLSVAGAIGAAALIGLMGVGSATAGADPGTGYPSFNNGVVNQIRGTGSDTTVFMMQKIGDLYTQAGLYGCTLNGAANVGLFNQAFVSTGSNEEYYCEGTWAALQAVTSTSSNVITAVSGTFPNLGTIPGGGIPIQGVNGDTTYIPSGTTITAENTPTDTQLTLSATPTADTPVSAGPTPPAGTQLGATFQYNSGFSGDQSTTDDADNWSRTEVAEGVDDVGSGAGQAQLCGTLSTPIPVNFARSSKPVGSATGALSGCTTSNLVLAGYAKDAVAGIVFQLNPSTMTSVAATHGPYASINGGKFGDVDRGWEPGDPTSGPNTGSVFNNITNNDGGAVSGGFPNSTAYRLWCASGTATPGSANTIASSSRISDWGVLTNRGPNLTLTNVALAPASAGTTINVPNATNLPSAIVGKTITDKTTPGNIPSGTTVTGITTGVGITLSNAITVTSTDNLSVAIGTTLAADSGFPNGIPINIVGVNSNSGTESTWASFAESGVSSGGCASTADPNASANGVANSRQALENNASQVGDFALADYGSDLGAQADEIASSIYYESDGVFSSTTYAGAVCFPDVVQLNGCDGGSTVYSAVETKANGVNTSDAGILANNYPLSRTLFNIFNKTNVTASTAGFVNWICDSQGNITKQKDNSTGVNFDNELTSTIQSFGFQRLDDASPTAAQEGVINGISSPGDTPGDNVSNGGTNTSCAQALATTGPNAGIAGNGTPPVTAADVAAKAGNGNL